MLSIFCLFCMSEVLWQSSIVSHTSSVKNLIRYTSKILFTSDFENTTLEYAAEIVKSVYTAYMILFLTSFKPGSKTAYQGTRQKY
jgi:hypothetical protein